ncbi:MAG: hypothetical protein KC464_13365, partial [Myxococcales bacterium]|nr:hypothetical protein [Myxococcales bacterium]
MISNHSRAARLALTIGAIALASITTGCKKKGTGGGGGGGAWLVGHAGTMANLLDDGTLGDGYALDADHDLYGITCRGLDTAFVAGDQGTVLRTFDGGDTWESLDLGTTATLRDVAAGGPDTVYVAGEHVLVVSYDSGDRWQPLRGGADHDWISLATEHTGAIALALDDAGALWRWDDVTGAMLEVTTVPGARAVTMSHDGHHAAVVGAGGAIVRSDDEGRSWTRVASGVDADLLAAWTTDDGALIAVGAAGTVVRVTATGVTAATPGTATLRALHVDAAGEGIAAGDGDEVLLTHDGGV